MNTELEMTRNMILYEGRPQYLVVMGEKNHKVSYTATLDLNYDII
jgi:hypothetical protein